MTVLHSAPATAIDKLLQTYPEINSRPAYLSRRVLFQAGLTNADRPMLESLRFGNLDCTVDDYLELIGLHPNEVPSLREAGELSISDTHAFNNVLNTVLSNTTAMATIKNRAKEIQQGIIKHVTKLITVNGKQAKKIALVDVGWNGTIQRLLQNLLAEAGLDISIIGLYMMTTPAVNEILFDGIIAKGYFVDGGAPESDFVSLSRTLEIFEQSCAPAHGSVLMHDVKTANPILKPDLIPSTQRADIEDIQEGISLFNELYRKHIPANRNVLDLRIMAEKIRPILRRAMLAPTQQEALLFSQWVHDDNLAASGVMPILGTEASRAFVRYKTIQQFMSTPMSDLYWPPGVLAINDPERAKLLATSWSSGLALDVLDVDTGLSTELACDNLANSQGGYRFDIKQHQHIFKNAAGWSYLRFDVEVDNDTILRWTPTSKGFEISIDFITFSFTAKTGIKTFARVDGSKLLGLNCAVVGMEAYDVSAWRGPGDGSAFYFKNLRAFGVEGSGKLAIEIACRVQMVNRPVAHSKIEIKAFTFPTGATLKSGHSFIETFNGSPTNGQKQLSSSTSSISLSGWMVDPEMKLGDGAFFVRLTNSLGESSFVPMQSVKRTDIAAQLRKNDEASTSLDFGFTLAGCKVPAGRYAATIVRKHQSEYLIGKDSWQITVDEGH